MDIDYTYHSHTKRCMHATGEDAEYAAAAYELGFKVYGFSDHLILPDLRQSGMRGNPEDLEDYLTSIAKLKKDYEGKMEIYTGFEAEFFPDYCDYCKSLLKDSLDYLILGQHCYLKDKEFLWYRKALSPAEGICKYTEDVLQGMRSGLYLYVAHPDYFYCFSRKCPDTAKEAARAILKEAVRLDMPLEINMGPSEWRKDTLLKMGGYPYPEEMFWKLAEEYPSLKVVLGTDHHNPEFLKQKPVEYYLDFVKRHHLNLLTRLDVKKRGLL